MEAESGGTHEARSSLDGNTSQWRKRIKAPGVLDDINFDAQRLSRIPPVQPIVSVRSTLTEDQPIVDNDSDLHHVSHSLDDPEGDMRDMFSSEEDTCL